MDTKNPRGAIARASVSIAADTDSLSQNCPLSQPLDDLARYRALHLVARFQLHPDLAVALASTVFGGGANG
jgi:hypothetical protein